LSINIAVSATEIINGEFGKLWGLEELRKNM